MFLKFLSCIKALRFCSSCRFEMVSGSRVAYLRDIGRPVIDWSWLPLLRMPAELRSGISPVVFLITLRLLWLFV